MKNLYYICLLFFINGPGGIFGQSQNTLKDTLTIWNNGEAIIGYYDIFNAEMVPLGSIGEKGNILINLENDPISRIMQEESEARDFPEEWKMKYNSLGNYFAGADDYIKVTNPKTLIAVLPELCFEVKGENFNRGVLLTVSSPGVADYLVTWGEALIKPGDYYLNWVFTNDAANVSGNFTLSSYTGNEDEMVEINTIVDLKFQKGWNIIKTEFSEIFTSENGNFNPVKVLLTRIDQVPRDAQWFAIID